MYHEGMIGKLTGQFGGVVSDGVVLIDVAGVGYTVRTPLLALESMRGAQEISLFIHTAVREDAIDLYGFLSEEELSFFKQLMSVSGIGPKSALGILGDAEVSSLKQAIASGDASILTTVFGIGKKSAERLVVELRDKIKLETSTRVADIAPNENDVDVVEALMALGYSAGESRRALKEVAFDTRGTSERLAEALRRLGTHPGRTSATA